MLGSIWSGPLSLEKRIRRCRVEVRGLKEVSGCGGRVLACGEEVPHPWPRPPRGFKKLSPRKNTLLILWGRLDIIGK